MERLVKLEVLGQEYPLYTDAPEEDVLEILHMVKSQLELTGHASTHVLPANKLAILTSLNIASQYVKLKREFSAYRQQIEEKVNLLSEKIEKNF
ncbi:MAG: cell division protein ZapA [Desulfobulbaceae bacterium]|nr:cell division protein ZapA [Desulfobulbaceae bacterium]